MASNIDIIGYDPNVRVRLRSLLHTRNMFTRFPCNHMLSKVSANLKEHRLTLLCNILKQDVGVNTRELPGWTGIKPLIEAHLLPLVANLIDNHRKYDYKGALRSAMKKRGPHTDSTNNDGVNIAIVDHYVSETIRVVIPPELVNRQGVAKLARSMVKGYLPLTMDHLMKYVLHSKTRSWVEMLPDQVWRNHLAAKVLLFIAADYIPNVVRATFMGARMVSGKSRPVFFPKPVWQSMSRRALDEMIQKGQLKKLERGEFVNEFLEPGVLRFSPKPSGLRPIVVRRIQGTELRGKLDKAKLLIKKKLCHPPLKMDIEWAKFRQLVDSARKAGEEGRIVFVKTDVRSAFVTVRHDKLLEILARHITQLPKEVKLERNPVTPWLLRKLEAEKGASQLEVKPKLVSVWRDTTFRVLRQEVENQVVRHGTRLYKLQSGLSQGSPLSNNLCNMVLDDLCDNILQSFSTQDGRSVLWRVADDFLFLTLSQDMAQKFKSTIITGFPDYGWQMNLEKTCDNIDEPKVTTVIFNGAVLDLLNLEAMADLSQHTPDNIFYSMTFAGEFSSLEEVYSRQVLFFGSLKLDTIFLNTNTARPDSLMQQISACGKLQALRVRALTLYLLGVRAKKDMTDFVTKTVITATECIGKRIFKLLTLTAPSPVSLNGIKWLLYIAIYKRSSGFLGLTRIVIKNKLSGLEAQINPQEMEQCYRVHNTSRQGDPSM